jgi:hypothetical protein
MIEEALEMCFPQPPTCYEEADIWFAEKLASCRNNAAATVVEMEECEKEAKELYYEMINDCEMAECMDKIRAELEPRFE